MIINVRQKYRIQRHMIETSYSEQDIRKVIHGITNIDTLIDVLSQIDKRIALIEMIQHKGLSSAKFDKLLAKLNKVNFNIKFTMDCLISNNNW